jgi:hypothetical protein
MINDAPLARFEPLGTALLKPIYADYSFGNIASTIEYLLTGDRLGPLLPEDCFGGDYPHPEKIVLIFIDAFGWQSWQRYKDRIPALSRVVHDGVLTPISAVFPSTTTASVSTINLGVLPAIHALYEWKIYIPAYGEVIQPLPFMPLGSHVPEACAAKGYDPAALLAVSETVHERLARHGVRSIQFAPRAHVKSSYNCIVSKGAELVSHGTLAQAMLQLRQAVESVEGKAYFGFYWPSIDTIAHQYGPYSDFHEAESVAFWAAFDAILGGLNTPDTLYLFTADHDQIAAKWDETIYINETIPEIADCLPRSPTGNPIYPNGSPRDLFLHVKPERRDDTLARLRAAYSDIAEIMTIDEALTQGLFGPLPGSDEMRRRLGDILVLPHDGHFIYWREPGIMENLFNGHHGGLAASELITVFGVTDQL